MSAIHNNEATSGGAGGERLERTIQMMIPAFVGDPFVTWQLPGFTVDDQRWLLPKLFRIIFSACGICSSIFYEVEDYASCAVLVPPGKHIDNPWITIRAGGISGVMTVGLAPSKCMILTYPAAKKAAIQCLFTKEEQKAHWYIYIMATKEEHRKQGFAGKLLTEMKKESRKDGRPMYIEATTKHSRDFYLKRGFATNEEATYVLGKGQVNEDGLPETGGCGVTIWPMIWRPQE